MFFKTCAALALATAAAAKPILAPRVEDLPAYSRRGTALAERDDRNGNGFNNNGFNNNGFNNNNNNNNNFNNDDFNLIDGFQNFNNQDTVIAVQEENVVVQQNRNGDVKIIQEKVNQVLVIDQEDNGRRKDMNNLFRRSNFRNNNRERTTVILVVTEVQIAIDDGRGNQFQQQVFAQSAIVANRGQRETDTVMLFESRTLIEQDINDNRNNRNGNNRNNNNGFNFPTTTGGRSFQTADVQLFDRRPTWSSVAEDPAATLGAIWEAELRDAQDANNNVGDNEQNKNAAQQEKAALEEAARQSEAAAASSTTSTVAVEATSVAAEATETTTTSVVAETAAAETSAAPAARS